MSIPRTASVVVVGGGVVGCSIAYHLARRGQRDVVVLEREAVGSGTTSKAAGGIRSQFPTETEIRFSLEAIGIFERFHEEFGVDIGYRRIGYLFLISDPEDLAGYHERMALQRRLGVDVRAITAAEAKAIVPALHVDDLIAAVWGPTDGMAGPAEVTSGFARRARELGARIVEGVEVTAIAVERGRTGGVTTSRGSISTLDSACGEKLNCSRMNPPMSRISSGSRYEGVPPPQCICTTSRSCEISGVNSSISFLR